MRKQRKQCPRLFYTWWTVANETDRHRQTAVRSTKPEAWQSPDLYLLMIKQLHRAFVHR